MSMEILSVKFCNDVPALQYIVDEAKRLGGLEIKIVESYDHQLVVAFAAFPEDIVSIQSSEHARSVALGDTGVAPALYRLLGQTLTHLGGIGHNHDMSFSLPLTETYVREFGRRYQNIGLLVLTYLVVMYAVVIAGITWLIWHYVLAYLLR